MSHIKQRKKGEVIKKYESANRCISVPYNKVLPEDLKMEDKRKTLQE